MSNYKIMWNYKYMLNYTLSMMCMKNINNKINDTKPCEG